MFRDDVLDFRNFLYCIFHAPDIAKEWLRRKEAENDTQTKDRLV